MVADGSVAPRLIVTGNPNVGKSVIFQLLTGRYATVSNYPGTTVMVAEGTMGLQGRSVRVSDTPGLNSLQAASEDEAVARDLLLGGGDPVVLRFQNFAEPCSQKGERFFQRCAGQTLVIFRFHIAYQ